MVVLARQFLRGRPNLWLERTRLTSLTNAAILSGVNVVEGQVLAQGRAAQPPCSAA